MKTTELDPADAAALIRARRGKTLKRFQELVAFHRSRGFSDAEIVRAMAKSPAMISALKLMGQS